MDCRCTLYTVIFVRWNMRRWKRIIAVSDRIHTDIGKNFPDGYLQREVLQRRLGSLSFAISNDPPVFWIVAKGFITPSLIREELPIVEEFGKRHPGGWDYVVDTTRVRMIHPYNPMLLRNVRNLPNIRRYIIIAPPMVRFFGRAVSWLIHPTHIVSNTDEALEITSKRVVS